MARIEPLPGHPAAAGTVGGKQTLVIADYHAGIEAALRAETGVELSSQAPTRRERLCSLIEQTDTRRLVILGDLMHSIGDPGGAERGEIEVLVEAIPESVELLLIKGNHDGDIDTWVPRVEIIESSGVCIDSVGFIHGHTWPSDEVLDAEIIFMGHEHPQVRLVDPVGATETRRCWLRGPLAKEPFDIQDGNWRTPELILTPAFNDRVGGAWVNDDTVEFLAPFLPAALPKATAYLLDGTRLGDYRAIDTDQQG